MPTRVGRNRRRLRDQADALQPARGGIADVLRFGIERAERADGAEEHAHRVRVVTEALDGLLEALGHHHVVADFLDPLVELRLVRKLSEEHQIGRFEVGAVLGELLDGVAAVHEDALVPVDERNAAAARGRVREGRVIRHHAEIVRPRFDLSQIHRANGAVLNRNLVLLAGAVVGDGQSVGHANVSQR